MSAPRFVRSGLIGAAATAVVAGMAGFAYPCLGAAIVGPMRQVSVEHKAAQGTDGIKAEYHRPPPSSTPFWGSAAHSLCP